MENITKVDSNTLEQTIPEQKITISKEQLKAELASIEEGVLRIEELMREPYKAQLEQLEEYKKVVIEKLNLFK